MEKHTLRGTSGSCVSLTKNWPFVAIVRSPFTAKWNVTADGGFGVSAAELQIAATITSLPVIGNRSILIRLFSAWPSMRHVIIILFPGSLNSMLITARNVSGFYSAAALTLNERETHCRPISHPAFSFSLGPCRK